MADIGSKEDGRLLRQEGGLVTREERVNASELDVHFKADVGAVLYLGASGVAHLNTLGWDTEYSVTHALDLGVEGNARGGEDAQEQLGLRLDSVAGLKPSSLQTCLDISVGVGVRDGRLLVGDVLLNSNKSFGVMTLVKIHDLLERERATHNYFLPCR